MANALTDIGVRNLKKGPKRREIPDPGSRGLYVVVQPSGVKSFAVRYRLNGKPQKLTLGHWQEAAADAAPIEPQVGDRALSLAAARKLAADALLQVGRGQNPAAAKRHAQDERTRAAENTLRAVAEEYLKREGGRLRSGDRRAADLKRLVYPTLGDDLIASIRRSDIIRLLDKIEAGELKDADGEQIKGGPVTADRTLALIRKIMNWHATRSDDFRSPIVRGMARVKAKERARERTLTDDELRAVWKAADKAEGPFGAFVQFVLLTTARRNEAAEMESTELTKNDWTLPAVRNKTKLDLVRPLSNAAKRALERTPRLAGCKFVFSTDGKNPISGFSGFKADFDVACGVTGWTLHDLRRTGRSLMSRAGVPTDHAERCLGHVIAGVRGTYDRYEYYAEKQHAYEALASQIERIINPLDNVAVLPTREARGAP